MKLDKWTHLPPSDSPDEIDQMNSPSSICFCWWNWPNELGFRHLTPQMKLTKWSHLPLSVSVDEIGQMILPSAIWLPRWNKPNELTFLYLFLLMKLAKWTHLPPSDSVVENRFSSVGWDFPSETISVRKFTLVSRDDIRGIRNAWWTKK